MGAKLDQVHANLGRISSALGVSRGESLSEAKKKKPKVKAGPKKGKGRKFEKQAKNLRQLGQGRRPYTDPHDEPHLPDRRPPASSAASEPEHPIIVRTPISPPQAKQPAPPTAPSSPSTAVVAAPKPRERREAPGVPPTPATLWQKIKRMTGFRRRQAGIPDAKPADQPTGIRARIKGVLKRLGGLRRRFLGSDVELPRTLHAMQLAEQRSSTTFKKCPKGAMISTPGMRHSMPKNTFVNPDEDNPTFPIRPGCRASKGGVLRALQKDMSGAGESTVKQVLQRINAQGGTRGKDKIKGWGTGVGGKRMETYRGKSGTPMRTKSLAKKLGISRKAASKLHGISTGRPDNVKHTAPYSPTGGSKGPSGNREVARAHGAHAKGEGKKRSKRSEKRRASSRAVTAARGKALIGR